MHERTHRKVWLLLILCGLCCFSGTGMAQETFIRGDVNGDGMVDLADVISSLVYLFQDGFSPTCLDALDTNDDGVIDLSDPIRSLTILFSYGFRPDPRPPYPECGLDPTDDALTCEAHWACQDVATLFIKGDGERNETPDVSDEDLQALAENNNAFAFDLYQRLSDGTGNLFFSPYSISSALAMLYAGANGGTETEMRDTLHFDMPEPGLHAAFNGLDLALESRGEGAAGQDGEGFRLNIANAIWGQKDFGFQGGYLDLLSENYGAGLGIMDFMMSPEPSRLAINDWVGEQTEGRIPDLLPQGSITTDTRLVLTNAIYFNAAWAFPFPTELTWDGDFNRLDGGVMTVPTMRQNGMFPMSTFDDGFAVELPYDGQELSMVLVVPDAGKFASVESGLTAGRVQGMVDDLSPAHIYLTMPLFSFSTDSRLSRTLAGMGMPSAFSAGGADFSGIDGSRNLYVTSVVHKAFVSVDEAGTEAAAATGVVVGIVSVPPLVSVNRPFIFLIRDVATGAVLFVGRVIDPTE